MVRRRRIYGMTRRETVAEISIAAPLPESPHATLLKMPHRVYVVIWWHTMILFDIPAALVVTGALSRHSRGAHRELILTYAAVGVAAPGIAFLAAYPDWDWSYLVDPQSLSATMPAWFLLAVMLMAWCGFWLGQRSARWLAAATAIPLLYTAFFFNQTLHVGNRAQYLAGAAPIFPADFRCFAMGWLSWVVFSFLVAWWWLGRRNRSTPS
jgi:hypothetical protein